jgi:hypothetical protein
MKTKLPLTLLLSFSFYLLSSQVPQGFNYQAIARDGTTGNPITDPIDVKIAILSDDDPETIIREELHSVDPDDHGLFSLVVGKGSWVSGLTNFSDIDWTVTPKYIRTMIFYGGEWKNMGPAQLWSVPYAMFSPSTSPWSLNGSSLYYSGGNIGIGTATPTSKLEVKGGESHFAYNAGNSALRFTTGYGNSFMFKPLDHALQIQTDHTGDPTILYLYKSGQVGVGNTDPAYILDISGRARIRSGGGSAGLWLMNNANTLDRSFIGMYEDNYVGLYGVGAGWGMLMNVNNGNVGIGTVNPAYKLEVNGGIATSGLVIASGVQTGLMIYKSDNSADQKCTEILSLGTNGNLVGRFVNDAYTQAENWLNVARNTGTYTVSSVTIPSGNFGVGTSTPAGRVEIVTPDTWPDETPLFEVKNKHGVAVLAVYNNGVKINIEHDPDGVKGPKGGFNIGGYDYTKGGTYTFMNVTPDSIRFNINNGTSKGPKGGFAIGGFGTTKGAINEDFMYITPQSSNGGNYNAKMGFEAGKNSAGPHNTYMGVQAGKGVAGSTAASNIFIGEGSGMNNSGSYVSYLLVLPGGGTTTAFNSWGGENVAVGNYTGVGLYGTFLHQSYGQRNVLIGHYTGFNLTTGSKNVIIGNSAGLDLVSGNGNIFLGYNAGRDELGSNKLYIANSSTSSPLIYGDYDLNYAKINGDFYVTVEAYKPGGGSWASSSDFRLKDIHGRFEKGLNEILGLNPVLYNYKEENTRNLPSEKEYVGFIAQEVKDYLPEAVSAGKDGYLNLDMHVIHVAMVNAIKEQQKLIEGQQKQIDRLEALVEKLMEQK